MSTPTLSSATTPFTRVLRFPSLTLHISGKEEACYSDEEYAMKFGFEHVAKLNQVHGSVTHVVHEPHSPPLDGDGLITSEPNLALSIRFADCQNFVVYAPRLRSGQAPCGVLGVLHVGWRGLAKGTITAFYAKLWEAFKIPPCETFVGAGPSICKLCATFSNPYAELPSDLHRFVSGNRVDLIAAAEAEFDSLGVPRSQRERHPSCTKCDPAWHSYRRDQNPEARNYLVAGL